MRSCKILLAVLLMSVVAISASIAEEAMPNTAAGDAALDSVLDVPDELALDGPGDLDLEEPEGLALDGVDGLGLDEVAGLEFEETQASSGAETPSAIETSSIMKSPGVASDAAEGAPEGWTGASGALSELQPPAKAEPGTKPPHGIVLGPEGLDTQGRRGRIHTVAKRDTLWDISEAYLGTPWVWPSIWQDNRAIDNPHLINPSDRIWITSTLMRRISEEEAIQFLAAEEAASAAEPAAAEDDGLDDLDLAVDDSLEDEIDPDAPQGGLSMGVPEAASGNEIGETMHLSWVEGMSYLAGEAYEAETSVVGTPLYRSLFSQGDEVYIGLGEGEVSLGDQFSVFKEAEQIRNPQTSMVYGYHVHVLAWGEITAVHEDTATLLIRRSVADFVIGDRVVPRVVPNPEIPLRNAPADIEATVVYLPDHRATMGMFDYVYLDRGALHGLQEGMLLEVTTQGRGGFDSVRSQRVQMPDVVHAEIVVVRAEPDTAVAVVTAATSEVEVGNRVRARTQAVAAAP